MALDGRTVRQRRLTSAFRLARPVKNVNGAEKLGHWGAKALTSLVGLAHWSRDSGRKQGQRAIRGGRGIVRRALYLCTWAVVRVDGELRRFYHSLRERGKPGNVAVVAVMRKLLLQLNSVARRGTPWVPQAG